MSEMNRMEPLHAPENAGTPADLRQLRDTQAKEGEKLDHADCSSGSVGRSDGSSTGPIDNAQATRESQLDSDGASKVQESVALEDGLHKSKFDSSNFPAEDSYDARVSQETRELASRANSPLVPMGEEIPDVRSAKGSYSDEEKATLKAEREKIDMPTESTVMQKVIGVDTGNIEKDLSRYLNPTDKNGVPQSADVTGFVAKAEDVAPFTRSPQECYENIRLDYEGTMFKDPNQPVYVLRFTDGTNYEIPYNAQFDGHCKDKQPCSGNGYLASEEHMIPEFKVVKDDEDNGAIITDGAIYRLNPDGSEELVAYYNNRDKCFELIPREAQL